jgi:hypothetical protein
MENDTLVIISPQKRLKTYALSEKDGSVNEIPESENSVNNALAYYQGISYLYKNRPDKI